MSTLGALLGAAAGPIAKRVLASLGIGVLSLAGMQISLLALLNQAKTTWASGSPEVIQYLAMAGIHTALSIIAGALVTRVAFVALKRFALI
jgi:hypothetical protein